MTPRQARVALGAFVLLAAGVAGNALYLQGGERAAARPPAATPLPEPQRPAAATSPTVAPAPPAESTPAKPPERASSDPPSQPSKGAQAVKVRMVRVATVGEAPQEEGDTETVRAVQAELNRLGYGPVVADGIMRPPARAAIMAFEQEHRLALTGQATQALLKLLLFGAPVPSGAAPGPVEVRSPQAQAMIRQVQQMLADRGYRVGPIDGRLSAETVAAIRTFEADQGLVPKGRISVLVLQRLEGGLGGGGRHKDP